MLNLKFELYEETYNLSQTYLFLSFFFFFLILTKVNNKYKLEQKRI